MLSHKIFKLLAYFGLLLALTFNLIACGQTGPLYLPEDCPEAEHAEHKDTILGRYPEF